MRRASSRQLWWRAGCRARVVWCWRSCRARHGRPGRGRSLRSVVGTSLIAGVLAACGDDRAAPPPAPPATIGRSVLGRPILARVVGDAQAPRRILVVGCIHGDEPAGIAVTTELRRATVPAAVVLWLVDAFNPDGCAAGTRLNAGRVDLNRNSTHRWRRRTGDFPPGERPLSEPESRSIEALVRRIRPAITIWYHQHAALVDDSGGDPAIERLYAALVGLPFTSYGNKPGSITSWQNATFPDATAFVVELPAGPLSPQDVRRHADAVVLLGGP